VTEADYDAVLNVNLKGYFATQVMVQHLMETKRTGKIINISSVHEELPFLISLLTAPAKVDENADPQPGG